MKQVVENSIAGRVWMAPEINNCDNNDLVTNILANRGITGASEIQNFLNPTIREYMPDPSALMDMDNAARVIADAVIARKKIAIYGDYDVDGITSTAIFVKYLRGVGADVVWHLPTREGEGYGLNNEAIEKIAADNVNLIITVDCGISAITEIARACELGMNVVVTDHHSVESQLPNADAVVNPKRTDDTSGLDYLAGVGVAFMTLVAVNRELKNRCIDVPLDLMNFMDMVALGTLCDTMPLVGLNRAFVATGLKIMNLRQNLGLRILADVAGVKKITSYSAVFAIGPRINAAGRLDSAAPALELLLTDNILIAQDLANKLNQMNTARISVQNAIMMAAGEIADKNQSAEKCSLFVCGDNWKKGLMGIVAGRLKDKYNLPVCVATKSDGIIDGSGRSVSDVDLGQIIHDAVGAGILSEGGGHAAAAGFTLSADKENEFIEFLENAARGQLNGRPPKSQTIADIEMDAGGATLGLVEQLAKIEPFGQSNPEPLLILNGAILQNVSTMGAAGVHLRGTIGTSNGRTLNFVGFNMVGTPVGDFLLDNANRNTKIRMLGKLKENEYQGRISVQFMLEDVAI